MLAINQSAPELNTVDQSGQLIKLDNFKHKKNVVLYFYPKDDTPGCTIEAQQFTLLSSEFDALDTVIIGVSKDSCESHQAFINKYALKVLLLSDSDGELCKRYGVWQEKEKNGEKKMGIVRSTFIIDKSGQIKTVIYGVNADGHAQEILQKIKNLKS